MVSEKAYVCMKCLKRVDEHQKIIVHRNGAAFLTFWFCPDCYRELKSILNQPPSLAFCKSCLASFLHDLILWTFATTCEDLHKHKISQTKVLQK